MQEQRASLLSGQSENVKQALTIEGQLSGLRLGHSSTCSRLDLSVTMNSSSSSMSVKDMEQQDHAMALELARSFSSSSLKLSSPPPLSLPSSPWKSRRSQALSATRSYLGSLSEQEGRSYSDRWKSLSLSSSVNEYTGLSKSLFPVPVSTNPIYAPGPGINCRHCLIPESSRKLYVHAACGAAYCHVCISTYHPGCRHAYSLGSRGMSSCPKCSGACKGITKESHRCDCSPLISTIGFPSP
jgi:hypothetical protein